MFSPTVNPDDCLIEQIRMLRRAASEVDPHWASLCYVAEGSDDGSLWNVAAYLDANGGAHSNFTGELKAALMMLGQEWREAMRASGKEPWAICACGAERESGNFDSFFIYPSSAEVRDWELDGHSANRLVAEAYARMDIWPKYENNSNPPR